MGGRACVCVVGEKSECGSGPRGSRLGAEGGGSSADPQDLGTESEEDRVGQRWADPDRLPGSLWTETRGEGTHEGETGRTTEGRGHGPSERVPASRTPEVTPWSERNQ